MSKAGPPIVVIGVSQRSGTNYLGDLLGLHPAVQRPRTVLENRFPYGAGALVDGVRAITHHYPEEWIDDEVAERQLSRRLGTAFLDWLADDAGVDGTHRLLTKTPGARDLQAVLRLFRDVHIVLLVRDGRDVVASGMAGLGWSFEEGIARWVVGAREILAAIGRPLLPDVRLRLVRYEDLVGDLDRTLTDLLSWLELDPGAYDLGAAHDLPVTGSSYVRGGREHVHWDPVPRPPEFDPRGRAEDWPPHLRARFAVRAGIELAALGYPEDVVLPTDRARAIVTESGVRLAGILRRAIRG